MLNKCVCRRTANEGLHRLETSQLFKIICVCLLIELRNTCVHLFLAMPRLTKKASLFLDLKL